jgi:hypothetical protein
MKAGVFGLLGILFVALKLLGFIDWSWFWVILPFFIPTIVFLSVFIVYMSTFGLFRKSKRK